MDKDQLSQCAREIANEISREDFDLWAAKEYPILYDILVNGEPVQIEIIYLETNMREGYLQLCISALAVGSAASSASHSAVIRRAVH